MQHESSLENFLSALSQHRWFSKLKKLTGESLSSSIDHNVKKTILLLTFTLLERCTTENFSATADADLILSTERYEKTLVEHEEMSVLKVDIFCKYLYEQPVN